MGAVTTYLAVVISAVNLSPAGGVTRDRVDLIEINHFYDEHGKHVFDQIIFYDWSDEDSRFQVRDWCLLKKPAQLPSRNWKHGDFVAVWHDAHQLRHVRAKSIRESWTQHDPELAERQFLPQEKRRKLAQQSLRGTRR